MVIDSSLIDANRFEILQSLRKDMLSETQEFRGAMWKITIATHALIVGIVGWLFTKEVKFDTTRKLILSLGVFTFVVTCLMVITSLKKHFTDHAIVMNKINYILGFYESGKFIANETLFPNKCSWVQFGEKGVQEPIFKSAFISILIVFVFAMCAIWIGA